MTSESLQTDLFGVSDVRARREHSAENVLSSDGTVVFLYADRLKKSFRAKKKIFENSYELLLPAYMKSPEFSPVRELAAEWARTSFKRKTAANKARAKELISRIWKATDQILVDLGLPRVTNDHRFPPICPVGRFYDLTQVFDAVNATYFGGELNARITWSNRIGGLSFHTVRKDPLSGETVNLISISRGYDFENCPFYAVAGVVYHECLHIVVPPETVNGRRIVHGKVFRNRERRYLYYEAWNRWHREVLPKNIRTLRFLKRIRR